MEKREAHEIENAPYLIDPKKPCRIVRNYELLPVDGLSNNLVLDFIDCNSPDEARRIRGWLWNAFAGGRRFEK